MHSTSALFLTAPAAWAAPAGEALSASQCLAELERSHHRVARRLERLETLVRAPEPATAPNLQPHALRLQEALREHRAALEQEAAGLLMWAELLPYLQGIKQAEKSLRRWLRSGASVEGEGGDALQALLLQGWRTLGGGLMLLRMGRVMAEQAEQRHLQDRPAHPVGVAIQEDKPRWLQLRRLGEQGLRWLQARGKWRR